MRKTSRRQKIIQQIKLGKTNQEILSSIRGVTKSQLYNARWEFNKSAGSDEVVKAKRPVGRPKKVITLTPSGVELLDKLASHDRNKVVNNPPHYTDGGMEVIDFIEAKKLNYHLGNVVKYVSRAGKKDNARTDLEKAKWYLERAIERI